ncbi:hypothetical protein ACB094_01G272500 [Castanea mollissima]
MANAWKRETHTILLIENNMLKNHFEPVFENLQRIYDGIYFNRVGAGIWSLFSMPPPPRTRVGTLHSIRATAISSSLNSQEKRKLRKMAAPPYAVKPVKQLGPDGGEEQIHKIRITLTSKNVKTIEKEG